MSKNLGNSKSSHSRWCTSLSCKTFVLGFRNNNLTLEELLMEYRK